MSQRCVWVLCGVFTFEGQITEGTSSVALQSCCCSWLAKINICKQKLCKWKKMIFFLIITCSLWLKRISSWMRGGFRCLKRLISLCLEFLDSILNDLFILVSQTFAFIFLCLWIFNIHLNEQCRYCMLYKYIIYPFKTLSPVRLGPNNVLLPA